MAMINNIDKQRAGEMCPFVSEPMEDCYCVNMNSGKIYFTTVFCCDNYAGCRIYREAVNRPEFSRSRTFQVSGDNSLEMQGGTDDRSA
jgi:hypothetical protein